MSLESLFQDRPDPAPTPRQFVEEYFQRLPFSLPGSARPLCERGSLEVLGQILSDQDADSMVVRQNERVAAAAPRSRQDAERLLAEGCTILVRHAERHDDNLAALAAGFARDFAAPVNIHMYATPPGQYGFGWHYDAEEVFIVQTQGDKEYALRKNTVNPWPLEETLPADMQYERELMPLSRCRLAAGDWLYIPSGYWHRAESVAEGPPALSLAIGVMPRTAIDLFDYLRSRLLDSLQWRQRLPVAGSASALEEQELREHLGRLLAELADDVGRQLKRDRFIDDVLAWLRRAPGE